jgi:hypothetical protein
MTTQRKPQPTDVPENPWMHEFRVYSDEVLIQVWRLFSERDTSAWQGVELERFEAAKDECFTEMVNRGLAL